ncbi:MAG: protease SohB [Bdellovibrionales bacterium]|nr:protease SohB [Bdellovibrionales bacterium]
MISIAELFNKVAPETLTFLLQAAIVLLVILGAVAGLMALFSIAGLRARPQARLEARSLNDEWIDRKRTLESFFLSKKELKARLKADRELENYRIEARTEKNRLWVIDFKGDMAASGVECLRNEITSVLEVAANGGGSSSAGQTPGQTPVAPVDEILLRIDSPGGTVTGYGHAAAQVERIRHAGLKVTVAIDEIAASGGYMMAVVASEIIAAPFAVIGSIGVVGQVPNIHRLLKRFDVDVLELTAGNNKRPVSLLGPLSDDGIQTFKKQLADTHRLFKDHVHRYRPGLDIEAVTQGDIWHGQDAVSVKLIDRLMTSDEFIDRARHEHGMDVFQVKWQPARSWRDRLEASGVSLIEKAISRALGRLSV